MAPRFPPASVEARAAILRFNITADIGWRGGGEGAVLYSLQPGWKTSIIQTSGESSTLSMGWLADWLWRSASKNRLRALFLILSQSLCFSQNYWCMSVLEKQKGNIKSAFEVQVFFCRTTTKRFHLNPDWCTAVVEKMQEINMSFIRDYASVWMLFGSIGQIHVEIRFSCAKLDNVWERWGRAPPPGWNSWESRARSTSGTLIHNQNNSEKWRMFVIVSPQLQQYVHVPLPSHLLLLLSSHTTLMHVYVALCNPGDGCCNEGVNSCNVGAGLTWSSQHNTRPAARCASEAVGASWTCMETSQWPLNTQPVLVEFLSLNAFLYFLM